MRMIMRMIIRLIMRMVIKLIMRMIMRLMKSNLNREFKKAPSAVTVVGFPVNSSFPDLFVELVWCLVEPTLRISIEV